MPTLQQLRYLVAIADSLHFGRAAARCHVTQPTLSAQLSALEQGLGVRLVERSRARVILTPEGAAITERARRVLREVDDIVATGRAASAPLGGTLRVGVVQSLGPYLLPLVIPDLHGMRPDLKLYVREGPAADLLTRLDQGEIDLLFTPLPVRGADLEDARLFREPLLVVAGTDHALAAEQGIARDRLAGETLLTLEPGHHLHEQVARICGETGARLNLDFGATSLDTLRQMVAMGLGLSLLPALYVRSEVRPNALVVARPLTGPQPFRTVGMVWRKRAARAVEHVELSQLLRAVLRRTAPEVTVID